MPSKTSGLIIKFESDCERNNEHIHAITKEETSCAKKLLLACLTFIPKPDLKLTICNLNNYSTYLSRDNKFPLSKSAEI